MARSSEKANTVLNRWHKMQEDERLGNMTTERPKNTMSVNIASVAIRWRNQVAHELSRKHSTIQNASIGEKRIRELNDEINALMQERARWDKRIAELGGASQSTGKELGSKKFVYGYYGQAKNLPGVEEHLKLREQPQIQPQKKRGELLLRVNTDYYGFRDEEDPQLLISEQEAEKRLLEEAIQKWEAERAKKLKESEEHGIHFISEEDAIELDNQLTEEQINEKQKPSEDNENNVDAVPEVPQPSKEKMEEILLERRKKALMDRYVSAELQEEIKASARNIYNNESAKPPCAK